MSKKSTNYPFPPSPPSVSVENMLPSYIPDRPPPPTYDESQREPLLSNQPLSGYPHMNQGYGHNPVVGYQQHPIPQNVYPTGPGVSGQPPLVQFDKGARFMGKTVSIPPPPPGYAPTPGQAAAYQGKQVILTQKQNKFF